MKSYTRASRDLLAARLRAQAASVIVAGTQRPIRGAVCPQPGPAAARTDVFPPAPGSTPGGHPA